MTNLTETVLKFAHKYGLSIVEEIQQSELTPYILHKTGKVHKYTLIIKGHLATYTVTLSKRKIETNDFPPFIITLLENFKASQE